MNVLLYFINSLYSQAIMGASSSRPSLPPSPLPPSPPPSQPLPQPSPQPLPQPSPPLPSPVGNNGWHGRRRQCSRPLKHNHRRRVPVSECRGGMGGTIPCFSCQLKIAENDPNFSYAVYVWRGKKYKGANRDLNLVMGSSGKYAYDEASPIIQTLICDYLDRFECLDRVIPPVDYIRNPNYVQRDEKAKEKAKEEAKEEAKKKATRIVYRDVYIIHKIKVAMEKLCWIRFGYCGFGTRYEVFAPDWDAYRDYCMKRWHDDEVPATEIDAEATRLINDALDKNPELA